MLEPHLGEIQWVAFTYAPRGWALCNGQLLPINQNQALFSLLGTHYGGNGQTTFALPNLQGRVIVGAGTPGPGQMGGAAEHRLTAAEMPAHLHTYPASDHRGTTGDPGAPAGAAFASGERTYTTQAAVNGTFHPSAVSVVGGSVPHQNMQPYLTLNAIIATQGIFPTFG
ncbi:phage tail protein [Nocardioides sp. SYSU D00065]|uniref:phage tail protein n=1 Tax=Nocardioides sp. SYSU D00065 TaxID=2817378 RepID=UPI001B319434|nr:tail fiber protein [Nocardioides sp. SYSU D00065]